MKKALVFALVSFALCLFAVISANQKANQNYPQNVSEISASDSDTGATAPLTGGAAVPASTKPSAGTASAAKPVTSGQSAAENKGSPATQKAVSIIKEKVGTDNGAKTLQYDHEETVQGKNYFVIHAYYAERGRTITCGCYFVDTETWKAYINNLSANSADEMLIPLD